MHMKETCLLSGVSDQRLLPDHFLKNAEADKSFSVTNWQPITIHCSNTVQQRLLKPLTLDQLELTFE